MADQPARTPALFNQVAFHVVLNSDLTESAAERLAQSLERNGAERVRLSEDNGRFDLDGITHIVSNTIDFPEYEKAVDLMISVVKPSWITSSLAKMKLANPRSHSPDPKLFFSGLVVYVADLPENDKNAIIGGVEAMGGIYAGAISKQVTHIVALSEAPDACQVAITRKLDIKIVLPHWFDDCLRLGHRISEGPYQLPNPKILDLQNNGVPPPKHDTKLIGISAQADFDDVLVGSPKARNVFKGHKIRLSSDLGLNDHLLDTVKSIIQSGGGEIAESLEEADTLVCQYRESQDFREAGQAGIIIGNLSWLYHIISIDSWASPLRRLLHFPISKAGLTGFNAYRLSLSNYNGDARLYLENLAKAAGCEFTKSMKVDNTHLITAHTMSEKCDAAKEWNIHMVNHLWLEESYAKWCVQSVANPRYTHFPARTNLGEVVGQTPIDKAVLEQKFFPPQEKISAQAKSKAAPKSTNTTEQTPKPDKAVSRAEVPRSSPALSHRNKDVNSTPVTAKKKRGSERAEEFATPVYVPSGKENETPSSGGRSGRSAKMKAVANMAGYSEDFALLEKQKKQKGGILHGGRSSEELVQSAGPKRSLSVEIVSGPDEPKLKKAKKEYPTPKIKLLVTGHLPWSEDKTVREKEADQLARLGIELTEDPITCSFVAAPKILRTKKFICAMAGGPTVLSTDFILQCLKQKALLKPADFPLVDKIGEKSFHLQMMDVAKRARTNQRQLLKGQTIYVTQDVKGGSGTYSDIVEANGGACVVYKGRAISITIAEDSIVKNAYAYLITGESKTEENLWPRFREQAESAGWQSRVVKTDWLLDLALSQQIRWDGSYEVDSP